MEADEKVFFEVQVTGGKAPYTYQWQEKRGAAFENIVGGMYGYNGYTSAYMEVDPAMAGPLIGNSYRCVVTDSNGTSITSNIAVVYEP